MRDEVMEELRDALRQCVMAMQEKKMCDNGFNIIGWEDRFESALIKGYNLERKMLQEEVDKIFTFVANAPTLHRKIVCQDCQSDSIKQLGGHSTLLGGDPDPNHYWITCKCKKCHAEFTYEHKDGYCWYTKEQRVLSGLPTCFESYILTCKECQGDVVREHRMLDGVTLITTGIVAYEVRDGKSVPQQRTFLKCKQCHKEMEYPRDHWAKYELRDDPANQTAT